MTPGEPVSAEQLLAAGLLDAGGYAQVKHAEQVARAMSEVEVEMRRAIMFFAPVLCGCDPWFSWLGRQPPQVGCPVHGQLMLASPEQGSQVIG